MVGVDGGVEHDPGAAAELGVRWEVDQHRLLVVAQPVHDVRTELDHLVEHVCNRKRQNVKLKRSGETSLVQDKDATNVKVNPGT